MNGRHRGTREESRKQALDSAWSMEMSRLMRDETAEPVSRDQFLRRERGQGIIHFPCSAADHEQGWQPCPVAMVIHLNIALHTYRCSYTYTKYAYTAVNRARRMYMSPNLNKQQYCTSTYICTYHGCICKDVELTTSRFGNLTRLIHITLL